MEFEGLTFTPLTVEDIPVLTPIMKRAFDDDSRLYFQNPVGGPPGYDDGSFLKKWGIDAGSAAYRFDLNGRPAGSVIVFIKRDTGEGYLGNIYIDPDLMRRGVGQRVWRFVEKTYPEIRAWSCDTPAVSFRNHCFYVNKCGFHVVAVTGGEDKYEAQFHLRKELNHD